MRRALVTVAALGALCALAAVAPSHLTVETCVKAADAGLLCAQSDGGQDKISRGCEIQNQGSTTLWCALANPADAVPLHSRSVAAGGTWSMDIAGQTSVWCSVTGVDQQTSLDGGTSGTADGGPAGCTISTLLH